MEQFLFIAHSRKRRLEFMLHVGLPRLLWTVEFCNNFAGAEDVWCPRECVQHLEDVVNRATGEIAFVLS